jgi:hypothetical protein
MKSSLNIIINFTIYSNFKDLGLAVALCDGQRETAREEEKARESNLLSQALLWQEVTRRTEVLSIQVARDERSSMLRR